MEPVIVTVGPVRVVRYDRGWTDDGSATDYQTLLEAFVWARQLEREGVPHKVEADDTAGNPVCVKTWGSR